MVDTTVQNYPGPYELRITYTSLPALAPVIPHIQRLNIDLVGTPAQAQPFSSYLIKDKDGDTAVQLDTMVEAYLAKFNAMFAATMTINLIELWKYPVAQSFDAVFWAAYTAVANVGTGAGANSASGQDIFTFRSKEGGTMKLSLMEDRTTAGVPLAYSGMGADGKALVDFILDGDGATFSAPFLARDTSYPIAVNKQFPGQNEGLWKKRNGR